MHVPSSFDGRRSLRICLDILSFFLAFRVSCARFWCFWLPTGFYTFDSAVYDSPSFSVCAVIIDRADATELGTRRPATLRACKRVGM